VLDGMLYAIGGYEGAPFLGSPIVEVYDPATDTWARKTDMPTPRWGLSSIAVHGVIYAIGGTLEDENAAGLNTVEAFASGSAPTRIEALGWGALKTLMRR
jgi:hypothetical protein